MKDLKLNKLAENQLNNGNLSRIKGGVEQQEEDDDCFRVCTCSCYYAGTPGGSSSFNNGTANHGLGTCGGYSTEGTNSGTFWYNG
ncbi:MAG: TIGR04149 family rSAM-modified RiPP [Bacteroidales bacterium]|jgi:natural product precursor|nr:TIGR04149 family rSAM-modified RiPP [Bacteroidales bacterium]